VTWRVGSVAAAVVAVPLLLLAAREGAQGLERTRAAQAPDRAELTLFPTGPWVRAAAAGWRRLAADWVWLEAIQYYGRHRQTDRRYPYAATLFATLTDLDPGFENAYVFGALILREAGKEPDAAYALLEKGIERNPRSWRLVFEVGFHRYLESQRSEEASRYLARAARMEGAPEWVVRLAAWAASRRGERDLALELWRQVLRGSGNEEVRRIARGKLRDLGAPEASEFPPDEV